MPQWEQIKYFLSLKTSVCMLSLRLVLGVSIFCVYKYLQIAEVTRPGVQQCQAQGLVFCPLI